MTANAPLLEVRDLKMHFPITQSGVLQRRAGSIKAVDGISFEIERGGTLALVGESGCGKTTAARAILQLYTPTAGEVIFDGHSLTSLKGARLRRMRRRIQIVFEDPYAALNPRQTVGDIIGEPLAVHNIAKGNARRERVRELLQVVGLNPYYAKRHLHEFSGGQRQRIAIARALAVRPDFIICDEPASALDISIQAQIVDLLASLQEEFDLTYLFIASDLSVVRPIADRVAIMYLGKIVELAGRRELYENPLHPYTQALLPAMPVRDPNVGEQRRPIILEGEMPSPANPPAGCNFSTRCPWVMDVCGEAEPEFRGVGSGHRVACFAVNP
jgi:oligopeptide transport system ATP-binding protein